MHPAAGTAALQSTHDRLSAGEVVMSWASKISKPFRIDHGKKFRLKDHDPADTGKLHSQEHAEELLAKGVAKMAELQDKLYAQDRWGLLLIFQAMDAAGKDGAIKHVMSGVNPQGCQVYSFKTPSTEELDHDYLWRNMKCLPERGRIGIFNRSYYEEVLVVRVHPEILANERMPAQLITKNIWEERFQDICSFERYLSRNGLVIRKFFLNVSKKEQKKRFLDRLDQPEKNWKFSTADLHERERWDDYMTAYEEMIANTSTPHAPWFVIPADNKWFTRLAVAAAIVDTLEELDLAYPKVDAQKKKELESARKMLLKSKQD
jgi:PPK2 family polyphosphate:nucleotide phosphotransferase